MTNPNKMPLDHEELIESIDDSKDRKTKLASIIEIIPILLIAGGILLRWMDIEQGGTLILIGGLFAALLYLFFSWYLFKVNEYVLVEIILSVFTGVVFTLAYLGIIFKIQHWEGGSEMFRGSLYLGIGLCAFSILLFLFNIRNERASRFYRNLLARILVLTAIVLSLTT